MGYLPTPYETLRQRMAPPVDETYGHKGLTSDGGYDQQGPQHTYARGLVDELTREPGAVFDTRIMRDRAPFYEDGQQRYHSPGDGWVDWTRAGPVKPAIHMGTAVLRRERGTSASRFPTVNNLVGLHTDGVTGVARTVRRYIVTPQMVGARTDRLQPSQYEGQSYSQTTIIQGGIR